MIIVRALTALATTAGLLAWVLVARADLVLAHYDAKAHLVVARRVLDSLTPGWQQIGAVWLPLPHLLQLLPTQIDLFYRTGHFAAWCSVACFGATAYAAARLTLATTGTPAAAAAAVALLACNPNLLYLQATPMTEPLLLALTFLAVLRTHQWLGDERPDAAVPPALGALYFAAAWTRYEAWLVVAAALAIVAVADSTRRALRLAVWPAAAVGLFLVNSRLTVGEWFVTGGFFEPDLFYEGRLLRSLLAVWWGTHELSGYLVSAAGVAGALIVAARVVAGAAPRRDLVLLALLAPAALPAYAFHAGHPFRIRYMVPTMAACALFAGMAAGFAPRRRVAAGAAAIVLVASLVVESPVWDRGAPLLVEAQVDAPNSRQRRTVTRCLTEGWDGGPVLASMGSLAHYMQELSHDGFRIADFVHEGNGPLWAAAWTGGAAAGARWMLVEEQAEGGDVLARAILADPSFGAGMRRICAGGGVALYRRDDARLVRAPSR